LAVSSSTNGGRSVGIVRSLTQAKEFSLVFGLEKDQGEWKYYDFCRHVPVVVNLLKTHRKEKYFGQNL
jgi:hypothetical protein